ncbi:MAG: glutamine synthetase beta-grasp domain-containing protein [Catalinimonas sp.]
MTKMKFEYIWLDGYTPEPNLRSKTKVIDFDVFDHLRDPLSKLPMWSYDGSSTQQAEGRSSDCLLKPVRVYPDPQRKNAYLVMAEVLSPDGTPHPTNYRHLLEDAEDFWFGYEQEYVLLQNGKPLGFPAEGYPEPQGKYYCSVGFPYNLGRDLVEEHLDACLDAGIALTGINAEVMIGQWEYQCFAKGAKKAADDLWVSRYLLYRISEKYKVKVEIEPKPVRGDWNGSGMHTNFSNSDMRETGGKALFDSICEALGERHSEHIAVYGSGNEHRLTGLHETQKIDTFSYGISDRGASIRIPISVIENDWKGYAEDRRPASNADPYRVAFRIVDTIKSRALVS